MRFRLTSVFVVAGTLSGCASSMSGLGGSERYACKAPEGVACTSVSAAYANSVRALPGPAQLSATKPTALPPLYEATPIAPANRIRSNPRLLRVWIAPWEDSDGDLHEEAFVHVIVDTGRWLIDHVRPAPRTSIDSVAPPPNAPESGPPAASEALMPPARLPLPAAGLPGIDSVPAER